MRTPDLPPENKSRRKALGTYRESMAGHVTAPRPPQSDWGCLVQAASPAQGVGVRAPSVATPSRGREQCRLRQPAPGRHAVAHVNVRDQVWWPPLPGNGSGSSGLVGLGNGISATLLFISPWRWTP